MLFLQREKTHLRFKTPKIEERRVTERSAFAAVQQILCLSNKEEQSDSLRKRSKSAPGTMADQVKTRARSVRTGKDSGPGTINVVLQHFLYVT